ncbi:MAG: ferritin-like domain-containing protein [Sphingobacteriales bacterium JAD_PAG50586_3]|nr:MAG: ferritin-like domain-containing protein [Sphingobacteriales bacterium JAD_PAG50586_3]
MKKENSPEVDFIHQPIGRLGFLKFSGAAVAATGLLVAGVGCKKDDDDDDNPMAEDLGSGDIGILNYAYALEQLEAAFYIQVMATPFAGMTQEEAQILGDLKNHEIAHRDFFKAAIPAANRIKDDLAVNFSSIDFNSRASVLGTAKAFEDLGVAAYNGAGQLIADVQYLALAGKIVSVEARHAAAIRDLLNPWSADFAGNDIIDGNGLDGAKTPAQVLAIAGTYISTPINASNLPS